jgi:NTE family protein
VQSLNIMLDRIARSRLAGEPPDVLVLPRLGHIGLLEFERADEAIAEGTNAVQRALPELADAIAVFRGKPIR